MLLTALRMHGHVFLQMQVQRLVVIQECFWLWRQILFLLPLLMDCYELPANTCVCWKLVIENNYHHKPRAVVVKIEEKSYSFFNLFLFLTAGTISGEEMPIIARMNIKEHRDSFSSEKFNFRLHHNITFYVYVSNFSWPIKIQVRLHGCRDVKSQESWECCNFIFIWLSNWL